MRFTVDVVLYHLPARTTAAREGRVVLRRTVFTALPDGSEVWVEELWTSETFAHVHPLLAVAHGIAGSARRLVLGEPVAVPDMEPVTGPVVDELVAVVDRAGTAGRVDRLAGFRGTVDVSTVEIAAGTRAMGHGELLCPSAGVLARPIRSAFRGVIAELGCTADGAAGVSTVLAEVSWAAGFAAGSARSGAGAAALDGTVAVIERGTCRWVATATRRTASSHRSAAPSVPPHCSPTTPTSSTR